MAKLNDVHQAMLEAQLEKLEGMHACYARDAASDEMRSVPAGLSFFCWGAQQNVTFTTVICQNVFNRRHLQDDGYRFACPW